MAGRVLEIANDALGIGAEKSLAETLKSFVVVKISAPLVNVASAESRGMGGEKSKLLDRNSL